MSDRDRDAERAGSLRPLRRSLQCVQQALVHVPSAAWPPTREIRLNANQVIGPQKPSRAPLTCGAASTASGRLRGHTRLLSRPTEPMAPAVVLTHVEDPYASHWSCGAENSDTVPPLLFSWEAQGPRHLHRRRGAASSFL